MVAYRFLSLLVSAMNSRHATSVNSSIGPRSPCLVSRIATRQSASATSTQLPVPSLWLDLRHPGNATSTQFPVPLLWLDLRHLGNATSTQFPVPLLWLDLRQDAYLSSLMMYAAPHASSGSSAALLVSRSRLSASASAASRRRPHCFSYGPTSAGSVRIGSAVMVSIATMAGSSGSS